MKYTVVTGASLGLGRAIAIRLAKEGKNLILIARSKGRLDALKKELESINRIEVLVKVRDLGDMAEVNSLYEDIKKYDIENFINNAGLGHSFGIDENDTKITENLIGVNINALTTLSIKYVQDNLLNTGATLVNIGSVLGYMMPKSGVVYSASKFYVNAFTEGLYRELKLSGAGVRVKLLAPAYIETNFMNTAKQSKEFDSLEGVAKKYHKPEEMADILVEFLKTDYPVATIKDLETYEVEFRECKHEIR